MPYKDIIDLTYINDQGDEFPMAKEYREQTQSPQVLPPPDCNGLSY